MHKGGQLDGLSASEPWVSSMTASSDILKRSTSGFIGRLVAPVAIAALLSLAVVLTLIWVAARGQDDVAAQSSADLMRTVLSELKNDLGKLAYDHSWWNEAIVNLIEQPNSEWAGANIGDYVAEIFDVSDTFVLSEDDRTLYAYEGGVPSRVVAETYLGPGLARLVMAARAAPMAEPEPAVGILAHEGKFHMVAVSALTPERPDNAQLAYRVRPVLLHSFDINDDLLKRISDTFGFVDLHLTDARPETGHGWMLFELQNFEGEPIGWLSWWPPHPGSELFSQVLPWLVLGILALIGLGYVFVRRVLQVARAMAFDAQELALKERELAQTSKLAVLGEMAAGMVHELNQPLNIIRMATDSTRASLERHGGEANSERLSEQLAVIGGQTRRMAETINSMRIFSRDDYGRKIAFDVVRAANQALSWLRPELAEHKVEVSLQVPPQCGRVFGEPSRFEQVMVNLILNARDAVRQYKANGLIDNCEIAIEITDELARGLVCITVRDNGGGIPAEHIERLFEPFYTTKEPGEGTGLGLSISYGIIGGMDGELSVRNHGAGAEFTIKLPRIAPKIVAETTISVEGHS